MPFMGVPPCEEFVGWLEQVLRLHAGVGDSGSRPIRQADPGTDGYALDPNFSFSQRQR